METAAAKPGTPGEKLVQVARARFRFSLQNRALNSLMFGAAVRCVSPEYAFKHMCRAEELVTCLLCRTASGPDSIPKTDQGKALLINFIALIKGYTYFAIEMCEVGGQKDFFQNQNPESALAAAMERFISSIQPSDHE
jgi:hypothetical protein